MRRQASLESDHSVPRQGIVPKRPDNLFKFWSRSTRSRAVATCYTQLWQMRNRGVAQAIEAYIATHPRAECEEVAAAFPDVYEAVIVALVRGPIQLNPNTREPNANLDNEEEDSEPSTETDSDSGSNAAVRPMPW